MTVSLPSDLQPFVDQLVASGNYPSADAVVNDALIQMRNSWTKFEELKRTFDEAVAELEAGGGQPLDFEEIKRKGRERLAKYRNQ